ncbi:MAG: hypothetical protein JST81_04185 [Bacteroidetes bacterium]|nr:hypothetical protein [Bacteroidota bacterium]
MIKYVLILVILLIGINSFGQIGSIPKFNKLRKKNITVFVFEMPCPQFIDTKEKYGFTIACSGTASKKLLKQNRKAIRQINKTYGMNWFKKNIDNLKQ